MIQQKKTKESLDLFNTRLDQFIDTTHELVVLAEGIDWHYFEKEFDSFYVDKNGQPGAPIRLIVGLHYLKHAFDESDEMVLYHFLENPYWQYFCGYEYFRRSLPIDPSSLTCFRKRIGLKGVEHLFGELLNTARLVRVLKEHHLSKVNIDTTIQEKAITFPTDSRYYHKIGAVLVKSAEERDIELRQNYRRLSKKALLRQSGYAWAQQYHRVSKMTRQLNTYLGRVHHDIIRKAGDLNDELVYLLNLGSRLQEQDRDSKQKLYSIRASEVEYISKGKAHKRYEFGCKVSLATSSRDNRILGIQAYHGNPHDGHILTASIGQVGRLTDWQIKWAYADLGYWGHDYQEEATINIVNFRAMKKKTQSVKRWLKGRSAIEPIIGHVKSGNGMRRNRRKGIEGDKINAILSECGFNMRKLLALFLLPILIWQKFEKILFENESIEI